MNFKKHDVAVVFVFGQSNAHGHNNVENNSDLIKEPMKNVFGLNSNENRAYGLSQVKFTGYSSYGMNLGENQDCTGRFATHLAKQWQAHIDNGNEMNLPDLYIVQVSVGGQGTIRGYFWDGKIVDMMWKPDRPKKIWIGEGNNCDITLYPLALETIENTMKFLNSEFSNPVALGLHWIGSESDVKPEDESFFDSATEYYKSFFAPMREKIGIQCPIYFYELCYGQYEKEEFNPVPAINAAFEKWAKEDGSVKIVRTSRSPMFNPSVEDKGIFQGDNIHYNATTHKWFAETFFDSLAE